MSKVINFNIDCNIFNSVYLPLLTDNTETQIIYGGTGAGKTVFVLGQRMIIDILQGNHNYLVTKKVGRTIRDSVFNEAIAGISELKASHLFKVNYTDMSITCIENDYQILFKGLDEVRKVKGIRPKRGVITDIVMEEADESTETDMKELLKRCRGLSTVKKRLIMLLNPMLKIHWIYERYFKGRFSDSDRFYKDDNLLILKVTYKDNKFLTVQDINRYENEDDDYLYNVYTLGNWGVLGQRVFNNWSIADLSFMRNRFDTYKNGLDFGFENDPSALSRSALYKNKIYITNELYDYHLTNQQIASKVLPIISTEPIYCDSAEPKSIWELRNTYKLNAFPSIKGPDSVRVGIQYLKNFKIIIDQQCINAINEFQLYQYKKNRITGKYINEPVDNNNHFIDAFRYSYSYDIFDRKTIRQYQRHIRQHSQGQDDKNITNTINSRNKIFTVPVDVSTTNTVNTTNKHKKRLPVYW